MPQRGRASKAGGPERDSGLIIHELYEAALEPAMWDDVGRRLRAAFDATSFILVTQFRQQGRVGMFETNWSAEQVSQYIGYYYAVDVWAEIGLGRAPMIAMIGDECVPDRDFAKSEIYADFAEPSDIRHMAAIWGRLEDGAQCSLALHRSRRRGNFAADQTRHLEILFPHILRSVRISEALGAARQSRGVCEATLNALGTAVIVVDGHGRVVLANRAAEAFAAARHGLCLSSGDPDRTIAAALPRDSQRLRALIVAAAPMGGGVPVGGSMRLSAESGVHGAVVTVAPLPQAMETLRGGTRTLALLVVTGVPAGPGSPERQLVELFGLTPAEARLAARLARGQMRQEYARETGITDFTVKTHLSRAFAKLGVHRESELVRFVLSLTQTSI